MSDPMFRDIRRSADHHEDVIRLVILTERIKTVMFEAIEQIARRTNNDVRPSASLEHLTLVPGLLAGLRDVGVSSPPSDTIGQSHMADSIKTLAIRILTHVVVMMSDFGIATSVDSQTTTSPHLHVAMHDAIRQLQQILSLEQSEEPASDEIPHGTPATDMPNFPTTSSINNRERYLADLTYEDTVDAHLKTDDLSPGEVGFPEVFHQDTTQDVCCETEAPAERPSNDECCNTDAPAESLQTTGKSPEDHSSDDDDDVMDGILGIYARGD